ncbi:unnamed protein product [Brassicogethes aeneus]|uniref:Peptidase S1 domain-containing protein n=1 Tax=Brassicogethes aeneus TaxID=1431903 RepID=A0A9P0B0F1_BRAAE|nr:unnamed protein product [Brassicogethes aeneus]
MKFEVVVCLCLLSFALAMDIKNAADNNRGSRKLFGGYRITPRFCKPTRKATDGAHGPSICMFNHECTQRQGQVVGACMDGFLFGACCLLPAGTTGELLESDLSSISSIDNKLTTRPGGFSVTGRPQISSTVDITSSGLSQIAQSLLNSAAIPTAQDNAVVQLSGDNSFFTTTGITHPSPDTIIVNQQDNEIVSTFFTPSTQPPIDKRTTVRMDQTTTYNRPTNLELSISNGPALFSTPKPIYSYKPSKPMFHQRPPKPTDDQYILVPTISHENKKNTSQSEFESVVNIMELLNKTHEIARTVLKNLPQLRMCLVPPPSRRPSISTANPPSTSYVFSTTVPPRRPISTTTTRTKTTSRKTSKPKTKKPTTNNPFYTTKKPPSTSYVYSSTPTRRPPSVVDTHVAGPGFSVTSSPASSSTGQYSSQPSPAPTVIVLSPLPDEDNDVITTKPIQKLPSNYQPIRPSTYQATRPTGTPNRKPVNSVIVNNHVTQNIYPHTSERPQPTVLITPKPSGTTSRPTTDLITAPVEVETSADDLINFPPVRNPNLNMSNPLLGDEGDITTPSFIEDEALNTQMESFVNKIIQGLQEPFEGLKEVVYNRNKTTSGSGNTTKKPVKKQECGVRPLVKTGRIVGGKGATFGEFPWQVLVRESTWLGLFTKNKCGGVLISNKYVMTAAHCQPGFLASLVAVFGEFDISGELETKRSISRNVKRVIVHRQYDAATFENDLALLELEQPVKFDSHIVPICLPHLSEDFTGRMATVTGWGRLKYGGGVPSVLQEVQVPIMENNVCQEMFRTAGHSKVILDSFLCAGYANGQKDSCEGDSGGPLVLQRPDGRYQLAGTVSHGIKCAAPYLPGVYMRTTYYKPWITSITGIF